MRQILPVNCVFEMVHLHGEIFCQCSDVIFLGILRSILLSLFLRFMAEVMLETHRTDCNARKEMFACKRHVRLQSCACVTLPQKFLCNPGPDDVQTNVRRCNFSHGICV